MITKRKLVKMIKSWMYDEYKDKFGDIDLCKRGLIVMPNTEGIWMRLPHTRRWCIYIVSTDTGYHIMNFRWYDNNYINIIINDDEITFDENSYFTDFTHDEMYSLYKYLGGK